MPRPFIKTVTVTGADDNTYATDMFTLSKEYPFVEWGILLSLNSGGSPRFPTQIWIHTLAEMKRAARPDIVLSGHLCGTWVRRLCKGDNLFAELPWLDAFDRYQLNFHAQPHQIDVPKMRAVLSSFPVYYKPFIFQADGVNDDLWIALQRQYTYPLFDRSGGAGIVPDKWPTPLAEYYGCAGGLSPDNVASEIERMAQTIGTGTRIWIDAETRLRSDDGVNDTLDMDKVEQYLIAAKPYVVGD